MAIILLEKLSRLKILVYLLNSYNAIGIFDGSGLFVNLAGNFICRMK